MCFGHFHELLPTVFGFQPDLHVSKEPWHFWEIWPETRRSRVLWPFSWAIARCFGVLERFTTTLWPDTCWRDMTRNSSFSLFLAVFMSYCPQFWGSRAIYNNLKTRYMFESYDQKLVVFVFMAIFMSYILEFLRSKRICMVIIQLHMNWLFFQIMH